MFLLLRVNIFDGFSRWFLFGGPGEAELLLAGLWLMMLPLSPAGNRQEIMYRIVMYYYYYDFLTYYKIKNKNEYQFCWPGSLVKS